jgi:hypothetical protein
VQVVPPPAVRLVAWQVTETPVMVGSGVSVMTADADLVVSWTLVAVTRTEDPVLGAVRRPAGVIVPADAEKVTDFEMVPVPVTVGEQVVVLPSTIVVAWQATAIEVMTLGSTSPRLTVPLLVGSVTLVAVTEIEGPIRDVGAVRTPVELIEPSEVDQVTADE